MQAPASFNLDVVKAQIEEAIKTEEPWHQPGLYLRETQAVRGCRNRIARL
jgi:hypothetical protein